MPRFGGFNPIGRGGFQSLSRKLLRYVTDRVIATRHSESMFGMVKTNAERQREYRQRAAAALRAKIELPEISNDELDAALVAMKAKVAAFIAADPRAALFSRRLQSWIDAGMNPVDAGILTYKEFGYSDRDAVKVMQSDIETLPDTIKNLNGG